MKTPSIKVKAMALFVSEGRLLVTPGFDSATQQPYFRLLGGSIEFGERSEETLVRELMEELGAAIEAEELLEVVQDCFDHEGRPFHEIAFVHRARFIDEDFLHRDTLPNIEPDNDEVSVWLPIAEVLNGPAPLFPSADYARHLQAAGAFTA
jgi:8-oxo-dGTP pyrophosphatase MutT (NUDIX family)